MKASSTGTLLELPVPHGFILRGRRGWGWSAHTPIVGFRRQLRRFSWVSMEEDTLHTRTVRKSNKWQTWPNFGPQMESTWQKQQLEKQLDVFGVFWNRFESIVMVDLGNKHGATFIYFGKICTPPRSYCIAPRLLISRKIFEKHRFFFHKTKRQSLLSR